MKFCKCSAKIARIIAAFFLLLASGCLFAQNEDFKPYEIDVYKSRNKQKDFYLSEIAESVEYVKLGKSQGGMISYANVYPLDDYFVISDWRQPVMVFSLKGEYIRSIGSFGNGPGEYSTAFGFDIDPTNHILYILNRNSRILHAYDTDGTLIKSLDLPYQSGNLCVMKNGNILIETLMNYKNDGCYPFCLLDTDGNLIREIKRPDLPEGKRMGFNPIPSFDRLSNGNVIVSNFARDTIYQIDLEGTLIPFAILDLGKLMLPDKLYYDMVSFAQGEGLFNYIVGPGLRSVGKYLKLNHSYHRQSHVGIFDPSTRELYFLSPSETEGMGFINDLDGGPTLWTHIHDEKYFCQRIEAIELIENRDFYASQKAKYPEKQKAFLELIDSLQPDDNPVVMIVKLK